MADLNPYSPPDSPSHPGPNLSASGSQIRLGPLVPVTFGLLVGALAAAISYHWHQIPEVIILLMPIGSILGGVYVRIRSRSSLADPSVKRQRLRSTVSLFLSNMAIVGFLLAVGENDVYLIGTTILMGVSMAIGIFVSGNRR